MKKLLTSLNAGVRWTGLPAPKHYERWVAFLHSAAVKLTKPWPLQAFWPLQELFALLHSLCPLQALPPLQATFASVPLLLAPPMSAQPVMKSAAAEAATAKPKIFLRSMIRSPSNVIDDLPGYGRRCLPQGEVRNGRVNGCGCG
jgi:hypothetical protein